MRLTAVHCGKKMSFLYRGKHRKVKPVELPALRERYQDLQRQELNMFILRHPYLTVEQSKNHMAEFSNPFAKRDMQNEARNAKFSKTLTWAEQLSHLRVKDAWD